MLMPECGGIGLDSGTFARHLDYRCDDIKVKKNKIKQSMKDTKTKHTENKYTIGHHSSRHEI